MKYTVSGFNQQALITLGLNFIDAEILRWFVDFQGTGRMREVTREDGRRFFMVSYRAVILDLPAMEITSTDSIARRFKKLTEAGVLDHFHYTVGGSFSCYRIGKNYLVLTSDPADDPPTFAPNPPTLKSDPSDVKVGPPPTLKSDPSDVKVGPPPTLKSEQKTLLPITHLPDSKTPLTPAGGTGDGSGQLLTDFENQGHGPKRYQHTEAMVNAYFAAWNAKGLPEFRKLLVNVPNHGELLESLSFYRFDEVHAAIDAYALVQQDPAYEIGFQYQTVVSFLVKGLEGFAPGAKPLERYRAKAGVSVENDDERVARLLAEAEQIQQENRVSRQAEAS